MKAKWVFIGAVVVFAFAMAGGAVLAADTDASNDEAGFVPLFNGKDLSGWKPLNPEAPMGWSVKDGVLINRTHHDEGKPRKAHTNIRTEREFVRSGFVVRYLVRNETDQLCFGS